MKISLEWLREYVDYGGDAEALADLLMGVGLNVEGIERAGEDRVLDVEVTSNRPDCLGHLGVAREVATVTGAKLKLPCVEFSESGKAVEQWTSVANEAADLCGRYTARVIDGVKVGASPGWMRRRLEAVGLRSINNVVDITNYVLMEIGQPLHSFDWAKLNEGRIVVRRARNGEQMVSIDETKLALNDRHLVIADAAGPVALAGVMGGLASEVSAATGTVLLESAHFDPLSVRTTSRSLGISSESSFRFERNVDMATAEWASRRAASLLSELAGGTVAPGVIDVWPGRREQQKASLRLSRLGLLTGIVIERDRVMEILSRLGFSPEFDGADTIACTVPSHRSDVGREADLIEEVIRIHGFGDIPTEQKIHITVATEDSRQRGRRRIVEALHGCGYFETVNIGFIEDEHWQAFSGEGAEAVRVKDATRKSANALRSSLLPSLLEVRKRNQDVGNTSCSFYEMAAVHERAKQAGELPKEAMLLGLLTDGDFRSLRGAVEAVVQSLDRQASVTCRPCERAWCESGTGGEFCVGDIVIGVGGAPSEVIMKQFDLQESVCVAELGFETLLGLVGKGVQLRALDRFPGVTRDLSLVLDEQVRWSELEEAILSLGIADLRGVEFVGIYRGKGVDAGKKSLTLSMSFRRAEGTLTHEEVDGYQEQVLLVLQKRFNAALRA